MRKTLLLGACLALLSSAAALAQDSNILLNAPGLIPKKPRPGLPDVKTTPLAWPRLDPGAVICRSETDLGRLVARRRGDPVDGPVDCQVIRAVTGIAIVQRKAPGLTQVTTNNPAAGGTGWTDAWLPDKAPVRAASTAR